MYQSDNNANQSAQESLPAQQPSVKDRRRAQLAAGYAARGWYLLPTRARVPVIKDWENEATCDPDEARAAWDRRGEWAGKNIGIACGPSNLVVIDLDTKKGKDGPAEFEKLLTEHEIDRDEVYKTWAVRTPSGGRHLYFEAPPGVEIRLSASQIAPGVDVRAWGGQVIAPGSDVDGRYYEPENDLPVNPLPPRLVELLTARTRSTAGTGEGRKAAPPIPEVIPEGERESQLASLAGSMRRRGASASVILGALERMNEEQCSPPLEQADLERIAGSIARYEPEDVPRTEQEQADEHGRMVAAEAARLRARKEATRVVAAEEITRTWSPPEEGGDLTTLLATPREPVPHRIEGLGKVGANTTIVAQYKAGKTTLIQNLGRTLADRVPFLGREVTTPLQGNIALWNYELDHDEFVDWLRDLGIENPHRIHVLTLRGHRHPLIVDHIAEWTARWLREREIEAWVLDPGARAFSGCGDENSNNDVSVFTEALDVIKKQAGVRDLYMTTHIGRMQESGQERTRGASRWDDWPDVLWRMGRKGDTRYFSAQGRKVEIDEFELGFDRTTNRLFPSGGAGRAAAALAEGVVWLAQTVKQHPGKPKSHWEGLMPGGAKAFRPACAKAEMDGLVRVEPGDRNSKLLFPAGG